MTAAMTRPWPLACMFYTAIQGNAQKEIKSVGGFSSDTANLVQNGLFLFLFIRNQVRMFLAEVI
jgi:hypothetical protein